MASFLDVHLKEVAKIVQAGAVCTELTLLLHAGGLGVALQDDEAAQLVAELAGHFLPDRLPLEIAKSNTTIGGGFGEKNAPPILRQPDVVEVRPACRVDAGRRAQIDLMVILKTLRPHLAPPV